MEREVKEAVKNYEIVELKYKEEQKKRRKLHNEIEDMKGKIRVFARVRPVNDKDSKAARNVINIPDEMSI
jgi:hypothetical protein